MIDRHVSSPPQSVVRLPVRPDAGRYLVLAAVFVCAACGLVYELELVALASYLIGDSVTQASVTQASVVLSVMVFAMGIGSLLAKRLRCRAAVGFGLLEAALALIGGCSAMVLYAFFAWVGESRLVLVGFSLAIGVLIGAEIPLLMSLIQRISRRDAEGTVADLFAADYVGALVGGLAFPFLLLPWLGPLTGALLTGAVNAVAGGALVLWLFRRDLTARSRWWLLVANVTVLALLATATVLVDDFERAARSAVYGQQVRVAVHTGVQEVVLTGGRSGPPDLFLDGRLRVSGRDEYRYHEALVHPAMRGRHARVLILGGGDGLAAREVLRYPDVRSVTVVEVDPGVVRLARSDPALAPLNEYAYRDPRVRVVTADAFSWLRAPRGTYDVVISDLPDPHITPSAKLYSLEFYGLAARVLADGGRLVVHAGPVASRPRTFWTVDATLRAAGFGARPYRATGGAAAPHDWGFLLAAAGPPPRLGLDRGAPRLRAPAPSALTAGAHGAGAEGIRLPELPPSTLVHPRYGD
ncbi:polyamine aminopropyltransferase [Streptomyces lunaelactis]|uniref:polyamine aminopropyltransferase n=1 Tax=Streptomyces lunaelactis TaxID=1535768 RepID=UPI001585B840|nr:polyamine aminopropyltransferase [Streptomyces lunaelactis]NUK12189.1 polyamine aminopropyltransferase [Streptomyces lunaelactis]NUK61560.1 polyamine aminopropyltransferase [Streptomyces lunaelactis]NUL27016.1 polyamine aminopropyltransferase [Streptomyces lunaelactis]